MLRPTARDIKVLDDYFLQIAFDNDEIKLFDVKPYIKGNWYSELEDINYFRTVTTDGYTICWEHGQDICPDELYYNSTS